MKSNHALGGEPVPLASGGLRQREGWHALCEAGLGACLFALPPLLALVPRGAAPLAAFAGLCAAGLVAAGPAARIAALRVPATLFGLLLLWGGSSFLWSIDPARSLVMEMRLAGLLSAALALLAAIPSIAAPRRVTFLAIAGSALAIVVAWYDLGTAGGLSRYVTIRQFAPPRLNQIAVWLTILLLPVAAFLYRAPKMPTDAATLPTPASGRGLGRGYGRALYGIAAGLTMGATVFLLEGTAAKIALLLSLPVAALLYLRLRVIAGLAAAVSVAAVLTSPLTLPRLADDPALFASADAFKTSFGHRLLIWDFAGKRIAERPLLGWGLDSARSIPGGKDRIRWQQDRMPLHPHDVPLQVWLELGLPGAVLFALLLGWLWLRLAAVLWPPLYAAAAGGSLAAVTAVLGAGWGIWQEWWLATLALTAFVIALMGRAIAEPAIPLPPPRGSPACGR